MKQRIKHLLLLILLIGIDQASKLWVKSDLMNQDPLIIIKDVLRLQYHENNGAVWGILSGKVVYLTIFTFLIMIFILYLYFKIPDDKKYNALKILTVFITAGAIGNLIDRMYLGYVVDFIYFEIINFPLFNIADSYLTVSSILLLILALFYYKDEDFAFLDQIFKRRNQNVSISEEDPSDEADDTEASDEDENMDV